jgi:hypothetical protein
VNDTVPSSRTRRWCSAHARRLRVTSLATLVGAALLAACGLVPRTRFRQTALAPRALTPKRPVEVQVVDRSIYARRDAVDIGLLESDSDGPASTSALLREEAARRGCDAIVYGPPHLYTRTHTIGASTSSEYTEYRASQAARCFVYR